MPITLHVKQNMCPIINNNCWTCPKSKSRKRKQFRCVQGESWKNRSLLIAYKINKRWNKHCYPKSNGRKLEEYNKNRKKKRKQLTVVVCQQLNLRLLKGKGRTSLWQMRLISIINKLPNIFFLDIISIINLLYQSHWY